MKKIIIILSAIMLNVAMGFAGHKVKQYTVIVDKQNGETTIFKVDSNAVITQNQYLAVPQRQGFVFQGWESNVDVAKPITKDSVKITAKWISVEEFQAQQDSISWEIAIQPKVKELVSEEVNSLRSQLFIAYGIAGLALLLAIVVFILFLQEKKKFRDNVLNLLTKENGQRMDEFINKIAQKLSSYQPAKIDEQQFKQLFDACWANKQQVVEQQKQQEEQRVVQQQLNQPKTLYADAIIDGKFHRVKEVADESETNFELKLNRASDTTAKVVVYQGAYRRILANPSFLEGCEKQLIGNNYTAVSMLKDGVAQKESDGKWRITTTPEVKIS
ncbi:MAG: hypothetical protein LBR17_07865 [Bacteroidales bacterium]|jgi:hypothetical protein|nr:hypothetical protein [Bacteroidales bacterium]